ncbi:MAG: T9SS type A sorting domain-containing protein, partial [Chlorobi bacterium]|nr:T9SS type A sorting domain-containing protein [Chlorobiota bacterium]
PEYRPPAKRKPKHLSAAPNPFDWGTYITARWEKAGNVRIEVYNTGGLRVKTLKSGHTPPGRDEIQWTGTDQNGNYLTPGIYHIVMYIDGKEVESLKVVKK